MCSVYNVDVCKDLYSGLNMIPINIIDLLPSVKKGIMLDYSFRSLLKIREIITGKSYHLNNITREKVIKLDDDGVKCVEEEACILLILEMSLQNKYLDPNNCDTNKFFFAAFGFDLNDKGKRILREFALKVVGQPRIDSLLVGILVKDDAVIEKYSDNKYSMGVRVWTICSKVGLDFPTIVKYRLLYKIFLCKNLFLNKDVTQYIVSMRVF